jgi:hypothetical protein
MLWRSSRRDGRERRGACERAAIKPGPSVFAAFLIYLGV